MHGSTSAVPLQSLAVSKDKLPIVFAGRVLARCGGMGLAEGQNIADPASGGITFFDPLVLHRKI